MDLGVWMSAATLDHKLEAREEQNTEQAWNLTRWPTVLSHPGDHRLFVASGGVWRGYFLLADEALYSPDAVAFTLLFDTRTWTEIPASVHVRRFRGFTYRVPAIAEDGTVTPPAPAKPRRPASAPER